MTDILLAKPTLPEGFIDASVGEAYVVRETLQRTFDLGIHELGMINALPQVQGKYEYPSPTGYHSLVKLLEDKYQAPVIITNGAKNALGAAMYALKKMGKRTIGMRTPYWALIPPLVKMHGMECTDEYDKQYTDQYEYCWDSFLAISPNNPDGHIFDQNIASYCQGTNTPLIHDAVYNSHCYLPRTVKLNPFGDVQIYSASKLYGLSGLRIGWAVCHNQTLYYLLQEYMESMTVGVSILPQIFLEQLLLQMEKYPDLTAQFEDESYRALTNAKEIMRNVDQGVLEIPDGVEDIPGMFLWAKLLRPDVLERAKINAIDGKYFGQPGFVRMNLALPAEFLTEIVNRLNSAG